MVAEKLVKHLILSSSTRPSSSSAASISGLVPDACQERVYRKCSQITPSRLMFSLFDLTCSGAKAGCSGRDHHRDRSVFKNSGRDVADSSRNGRTCDSFRQREGGGSALSFVQYPRWSRIPLRPSALSRRHRRKWTTSRPNRRIQRKLLQSLSRKALMGR